MTTTAAPEPAFLRIEPGFRDRDPGDPKRGRLRWGAVIVALLLHALVIAAFIAELPLSFAPDLTQPPPIAVSLVMEPPKPPPAPAKTEPQPQVTHDLVSGKDQETTAPPQDKDKGEDAAPKLKPPPEPEKPDPSEAAAPQPKPRPTPSQPKTKEAAR